MKTRWWWGSGSAADLPSLPVGPYTVVDNLLHVGDQPVFPAAVDAFDLLHAYLEGHDITPFLDWADHCGFDELRAFGQWEITKFYPAHYGDAYYDGVRSLVQLLAARPRPIRLKLVVLTSGNEIPRAQWADPYRVADILKDEWAWRGSLGNEWPQNGFDPYEFVVPSHGVWARGSALGDELPPFSPWHVSEFHAPRDVKRFNGVLCRSWVHSSKAMWELRHGDNGMKFVYPVVEIDEPIAWGPVNEDGRTDSDPFSAWQYAASTRAFGGTSVTFHYRPVGDTPLNLPDDVTTACAQAFVRGARLPLGQCAQGIFRHAAGLHFVSTDRFIDPNGVDPAGTMDSYEMQQGNRIEGLALQPGEDWRLQPINATVKETYAYATEAPSIFVLEG